MTCQAPMIPVRSSRNEAKCCGWLPRDSKFLGGRLSLHPGGLQVWYAGVLQVHVRTESPRALSLSPPLCIRCSSSFAGQVTMATPTRDAMLNCRRAVRSSAIFLNFNLRVELYLFFSQNFLDDQKTFIFLFFQLSQLQQLLLFNTVNIISTFFNF